MSDTADTSDPDGAESQDDAAQQFDAAIDSSADSSSADASEPKIDTIESLRDELAQAGQRALLAQAELENYRKRTQRFAEEERKYAALPCLRDLLPVIDNLRRAVDAAGDEHSGEGIVQGVEMVCEQIEMLLSQHQCAKIDPLGETFDPEFHEAVGQQPDEQIPQGQVSLVMQTGYRLHDRVIRPAQVFVSLGPAKTDAPSNDKSSDDPTPMAGEN
jgi:molecular chaperone GrpE